MPLGPHRPSAILLGGRRPQGSAGGATMEKETRHMEGRTLGSYGLREQLGSGATGTVYRAQHLRLGREAAVRVLPAALMGQPDAPARFARVMAGVAALDHPHILPVWDYGEQDGTAYLVMRLVRGGTLRDRLTQGPLPRTQAAAYVRQLAAALDHAHERGLVHRAVAPANVLLEERGRLYLADFGLAELLADLGPSSQLGTGVGTPAYLAPEQAQGRVDARSDLYALGVILYQMLTGRVPFSGNSAGEVLRQHQQAPVPLLPLQETAPGMEHVLQQALAKEPRERYATGRALADAVDPAPLQGFGGPPLGPFPDRRPAGPTVSPVAGEAEAAVTEAVFRYYLRNYKHPVAFLSLGQEEPSERFLRRFQDLADIVVAARWRRWPGLGRLGWRGGGRLRLKRGAQARVALDEVTDPETGHQGVIFSVSGLRWVSEAEAEVDAGVTVGGLLGRGVTLRVVREGERWVVDERAIRPTWIA